MMKLVERIIIKPNHKYFNEIDHICFLSKNLYNSTLYAVRQHYFETGKYLNYVQRKTYVACGRVREKACADFCRNR